MASASDSMSEPPKKKAKHDSGSIECDTDSMSEVRLIDSMSEVSKRLLNISELNYDVIVDLKFLFSLESLGLRKTIDFCMKLGLICSRYECPKCKNDMVLKEIHNKDGTNEFEWQCSSEKENYQKIMRSVRKGSWFYRSSLNMVLVLQIVWLWVWQCSGEMILDVTKVARMTVQNWKIYCREVCVQLIIGESETIGGPGMVVEIELSRTGGKPRFKRGENLEGKWLIGGVERLSNRCFMKVVSDNSSESLASVLREYIHPDTTVMSDNWKLYDCQHDKGLLDLQFNHGLQFKDPDKTGLRTKSTWFTYKPSLGHIVKDSMAYYMAEYMWRKKLKKGNKFMQFIDAIVKVYPPLCRDEDNE